MDKKVNPQQSSPIGIVTGKRKWGILKSVLSILGFLMVFFFLISGIVGFSLFLIFFGVSLIFKKYFLYTIPLVLIFMIVAIMQLVFIANFIFKTPKISTSNLYEIDANNYPKLFAFIRSVAMESKIKFPKKIFLIPDSNAYVFFEARFWHLFFPPQKNLCIGVGLLNVLNQSELKCILAHEFGHFKQNSIKIESYVNTANQVIYNLLFGQEKLDRLRNILPKVFPNFIYYMEFGNFLISITEDILRWLFIKINTHHNSLKRTLEYDADHFSASVYGSESMVQALTMLRYADYAMNDILWFFNTNPNLGTTNIYTLQNYLFNKLQTENLSPKDIAAWEHSFFFRRNSLYSGIKIQGNFDTHPAWIDRISFLLELNHPTKRNEGTKVNELLSGNNEIFEIFTTKIFEEIVSSESQTDISPEEFEGYYHEKQNTLNIGEPFGRFYAIYSPNFNFSISNFIQFNVLKIRELFTEENQKKAFGLSILKEDLNVLQQIESGELVTDFFEYEGCRFYKDQTKELEKEIKLKISNIQEELTQIDQKVLSCFSKLSNLQDKSDQFSKIIEAYNHANSEYFDNQGISAKMNEAQKFFYKEAPPDIILIKMKTFREVEKDFKKAIEKTIGIDNKENIFSNDSLALVQEYLQGDLQYFSGISYNENEVFLLQTASIGFEALANQKFEYYKKQTLDFFKEMYQRNLTGN